MIARDDQGLLCLEHETLGWQARHSLEQAGGPVEVRTGAGAVLAGVHFHVDDFGIDNAVVEGCRAYHRGGAGVVECSGFFPFGNAIRFRQVCRYAANHVRVTLDLDWPSGSRVQRHFGVGGMVLPGSWARMFVVPPASHWVAGVAPAWYELPAAAAGPRMVGHWHRPPLALVFEQHDGRRVEIGTGPDVWRWEEGLEAGPEAGSYKVMLEADGLRLVREPLMTCLGHEPRPRPYRFQWYAAWAAPRGTAAAPAAVGGIAVAVGENRKLSFAESPPEAEPVLVWDCGRQSWPPAARACPAPAAPPAVGEAVQPCFASDSAARLLRTLVRGLRGRFADGGTLLVRGLAPALCFEPAHPGRRKGQDTMAHWDVGSLLDLGVWARNQLGPEWRIGCEPATAWPLPSLRGLFTPNGFTPGEDAEGDDDGDDNQRGE
jgi:hypothetical protein